MIDEERKLRRNTGNAGKGRPKGVPNKTTMAAKEAFAMAFDGLGGVAALQTWATTNPTEFYKLYGRLIPVDLKGDVTGELVIRWLSEKS